jgi:hypothetical protein
LTVFAVKHMADGLYAAATAGLVAVYKDTVCFSFPFILMGPE